MKKSIVACLAVFLLMGCTGLKVSTDSSITFGEKTSISGSGLRLEDNTVTITSPGTYEISGTSNTGKIVIDTSSKGSVKLILNNVNLVSTSGPVIDVQNADSTIIEVKENTTSSISVAGQNKEEEDSAIYAKDDISFTGSGTLKITGENDAIHANDDCTIDSITLDITAGDDGMDVNDNITISNAVISMIVDGGYENGMSNSMNFMEKRMNQDNLGENLLQEKERTDFDENTPDRFDRPSLEENSDESIPSFDKTKEHQKMPDNFPQELNNAANKKTGCKGIKSDGNITIEKSVININSSDDAMHSNGDIRICDSDITLSSGDDGIHADNSLTIESGNIKIENSYEGLESSLLTIESGNIEIHASDDGINSTDSNSESGMQSDTSLLEIKGGNIVVYADGDGIDMNGDGKMTGGMLTIYGPETSKDGAIDYNGTFILTSGTILAGGASGMAQMPSEESEANMLMLDASGDIEIEDSTGNICFRYTSEKAFNNLVIVSDLLKLNEEYKIYENGLLVQTITLTSKVTNLSKGQTQDFFSRGENKVPFQK